MICPSCRDGSHGKCPEGTWCNCQHRTTEADTSESAGESSEPDPQQ